MSASSRYRNLPKGQTMSNQFEVLLQETHVVTRRVLVEACNPEEARELAEGGDTIADSEALRNDGVLDRNIVQMVELPARGASLERVFNALRKTSAFMIHARLWGATGLEEEREYQVFSVDLRSASPSIEIADFPMCVDRRVVSANKIFGLRIESESDDVPYLVSCIRYDTDGETATVDLPEEMEIDVPRDTPDWQIEDVLGEAISERTGWCHKSFNYKKAA